MIIDPLEGFYEPCIRSLQKRSMVSVCVYSFLSGDISSCVGIINYTRYCVYSCVYHGIAATYCFFKSAGAGPPRGSGASTPLADNCSVLQQRERQFIVSGLRKSRR